MKEIIEIQLSNKARDYAKSKHEEVIKNTAMHLIISIFLIPTW